MNVKNNKLNKLKLLQNKNYYKTDERIHMETMIIQKNKHPDSFEWTENFDGYIIINDKKYYFNLKFVCDQGGAQTRTLREVYHFIKCQSQIHFL